MHLEAFPFTIYLIAETPFIYSVKFIVVIMCFILFSSVVKSSLRHQTTSPLSRVGPTASLRDVEPDFVGPIENVTVALGREAVLTCSVSDLGDYKVRFFGYFFLNKKWHPVYFTIATNRDFTVEIFCTDFIILTRKGVGGRRKISTLRQVSVACFPVSQP